jgi:hypothetical protein
MMIKPRYILSYFWSGKPVDSLDPDMTTAFCSENCSEWIPGKVYTPRHSTGNDVQTLGPF